MPIAVTLFMEGKPSHIPTIWPSQPYSYEYPDTRAMLVVGCEEDDSGGVVSYMAQPDAAALTLGEKVRSTVDSGEPEAFIGADESYACLVDMGFAVGTLVFRHYSD